MAYWRDDYRLFREQKKLDAEQSRAEEAIRRRKIAAEPTRSNT
jgi:hypothetical protein